MMTAMEKNNGFVPFSRKQLKALTWWLPGSPTAHFDGIICDGAVRSGKTLCMTVSFITMAMSRFDSAQFAICGKTIASVRRNITSPILPVLASLGFAFEEKISRNQIEVRAFGHRNTFYLFGGKDESSASLIQGITLSGVLLDEVALMPRSFAEQAIARCSAEGAKLWFNCNPEHPQHWFHREWIEKAEQKNALYLHFRMQDNPSLSEKMIQRYRSLYSDAFYDRFVLGRWTAAMGLVYPFFGQANLCDDPPTDCECYCISCDYGTVNPTSMGLWGRKEGVWYRLEEYYYSSKAAGEQKTDEEYYAALEELAGARPIQAVVCDPSAASFITCVRRHGRFAVLPARNDVLDGIRRVCDALKSGRIRIGCRCRDAIREFGLYRWEEGGAKDAPRKENDHAMDDIRYFVATVLDPPEEDGFALAAPRR